MSRAWGFVFPRKIYLDFPRLSFARFLGQVNIKCNFLLVANISWIKNEPAPCPIGGWENGGGRGWEKCVAPLAVSHLKFFLPPKKWNVLLRHCHTSTWGRRTKDEGGVSSNVMKRGKCGGSGVRGLKEGQRLLGFFRLLPRHQKFRMPGRHFFPLAYDIFVRMSVRRRLRRPKRKLFKWLLWATHTGTHPWQRNSSA